MAEKLDSHPDTQKHFDILFTKVGELIQGMGRKRSELQISDWEKILKELDQKILKTEKIYNVEGLKKFIQIKDRFSDEELQKMAESFKEGKQYNGESGELIYQLSPNDAVKLLIKALIFCQPDEAIRMTDFVATHFEYLKNAKNIDTVLKILSHNNPGMLFYGFQKFRREKNSFQLLKDTVSHIADVDEVLLGKFIDSHLDSLGLSKLEKDQILILAESKRKSMQLLRDIMGSGSDNIHKQLLGDGALMNIDQIQSEWIIPHLQKYVPKIDQKTVSRWISMVARNLFFQKKEVNQENAVQEIRRIIKMRKELASTPLFQGRNILFAAHTEKNDTEGNFFGKKTVISALEKQGGKVDFQRPENIDEETVIKKKTDVLNKFKTTPPPFVFIFDGHGQEQGLYFTGGEAPGVRGNKKNEINISTQELIEAYKERLKNFPALQSAPLAQRDYLIFNTCLGHDFLRNFYDGLPAGINKPITIASAEFGQVTYTLENNDYENDFFERTLDLKNPNGVTTFENVFQGDEKEEASNPSLYVPDDNNKPGHISQSAQNESINMV